LNKIGEEGIYLESNRMEEYELDDHHDDADDDSLKVYTFGDGLVEVACFALLLTYVPFLLFSLSPAARHHHPY
jgi:hypothetical protein